MYCICCFLLGKYIVKDMNVYIEPLVDELVKLWNGVTMYDVSRPVGQREFQFHAMLAWTIHDAPGLTHFCGLQTKGKFACPVCGPKMKSRHSKSLSKEVFDEYRHFLSKNHRYRTVEKHLFNGKEETALKPQRMTPRMWKLQYNRNRQGTIQFVYLIYSY